MTENTPTRTEPHEGETARYVFTSTAGTTAIVTARYEESWRGGITPCVQYDAVADILETWAAVDPDHRRHRWASTERDDDDCFLAYLDHEGHVVLDNWKVGTETDHFPLGDLASLLPADHYTLTPIIES